MLGQRECQASRLSSDVENLIALATHGILLNPAHSLESLDLIVKIAPELYVVNRPMKLTGIAGPQASDRELLEVSILEQLEDMPV